MTSKRFRQPLAATSQYASGLAALLSGALAPLALAPVGWWPVAILCCALLSHLLRGEGIKRAAFICWLFGVGMYGVGASWVYVSIHQYGHAPAPLAILLTALFVMGLAAVFALPLSLYGAFKHSTGVKLALAFTALWVLGEWFRSWFLSGFPWLYLGYGFIDTWLAGWAPVGGVLTMSAIVAGSGATLSHVLSRPQKWPAVLASLLVVGCWCSGQVLRDIPWTQPAVGQPLTVALIQPNLPVLAKWQEEELPDILQTMHQQATALADRDLIIWPESGIPALPGQVGNFLKTLHTTASQQQTALISGIPSQINGAYFNSVVGLGNASGTYHKRRLVPFGEYVPLESALRGVIEFFDLPMSSFRAGAARQPLLKAGNYRIATAICYEIAYAELIARDAGDAHMLLTVSNDTWFGDSLGPHQHLQIARVRALETGKPLLRATNDGITAIVDHRGRVTRRLPRFSAGVLDGEITPFKGATPYSRQPTLPVMLFGVVLSLLLITSWRHR